MLHPCGIWCLPARALFALWFLSHAPCGGSHPVIPFAFHRHIPFPAPQRWDLNTWPSEAAPKASFAVSSVPTLSTSLCAPCSPSLPHLTDKPGPSARLSKKIYPLTLCVSLSHGTVPLVPVSTNGTVPCASLQPPPPMCSTSLPIPCLVFHPPTLPGG